MLVHLDRVNSESVRRLLKESKCRTTLVLDNKNVLNFKNTKDLFTVPNISGGSKDVELEFILRYLDMLDATDFKYTDLFIVADKIEKYDVHAINAKYKTLKSKVNLHILFEGTKNTMVVE